MKPSVIITLVDKKGHAGCHRGHRIGDSFDFDTDRGKLCPMAMHVAFPYVDIIRYGEKHRLTEMEISVSAALTVM